MGRHPPDTGFLSIDALLLRAAYTSGLMACGMDRRGGLRIVGSTAGNDGGRLLSAAAEPRSPRTPGTIWTAPVDMAMGGHEATPPRTGSGDAFSIPAGCTQWEKLPS